MLGFISILDQCDSSKWMRVKFIKRTDGTIREMTCRTGVKQGVQGKGLVYNPKDKNLLVVWIPEQDRRDNTRDNGYRCLPIDSVLEVHAEGKVWK